MDREGGPVSIKQRQPRSNLSCVRGQRFDLVSELHTEEETRSAGKEESRHRRKAVGRLRRLDKNTLGSQLRVWSDRCELCHELLRGTALNIY